MRPHRRVPRLQHFAAALAFAAAAACRPAAAPSGLGPEHRVQGVYKPGMILVFAAGGVPAMRAPLAPLRWPDDTTSCPETHVAAAGAGDAAYAAWWRPDSAAGAVLLLARSPDGGIHWDEPLVVASAAPRTPACARPPPGIAVDRATGRVALAFHGLVGDSAALAIAVVDAGSRAAPQSIAMAAGRTPRAAAIAVAHDTVVVAFESPSAADGAIWLAISTGSGHISPVARRVTMDGVRAFAPSVAIQDGVMAVAWNEAARGPDGPEVVVRTGRIGG